MLFVRIDIEHIKVFHGTVHHGACVNTDQCIEEVVAAFNGAFHDSSGVQAGIVGHVVSCDIHRACIGSSQTGGEAVIDIQDYLGNVIASVPQTNLSVILSLLDELVVSILKQVLKIDCVL